MSRLPISRTVGWTVITWGIITGCLAAPSNFSGFTAVRFLLGFTEGGVSPAFFIITFLVQNIRAAFPSRQMGDL